MLIAGCGAPEQSPSPQLYEVPTTLNGFRHEAWFLPDDDLLGFVEILAGPFLMGSDPAVDPQAFDNERWSSQETQGTVDLPRFFVSRTEVTVAQFLAFVIETGTSVSDDALSGQPAHPVASVSWPDAVAYCRWLDTTLRNWPGTPTVLRDLLRDGWHVTLPNEAEWEKAARGINGQVYPWGNELNANIGNYDSPGVRPVGSVECPTCAFGLNDMSGNVWELTRSAYRPYPFTANAAVGLQTDALFVMRGGSYIDQANTVRAAVRGGTDPGVRRPFIGFRVVISRF